jgi:hypothetical protein
MVGYFAYLPGIHGFLKNPFPLPQEISKKDEEQSLPLE